MSKHEDNHDDIAITLSPVQVEQVMRSASKNQNGTVSNLLLAALDNAHDPPSGSDRRAYDLQRASQEALDAALEDPQLSQSLLRGLSVLSCYGPDRRWKPIIELANQLGMSPSTTHRYVKTLKTVGLMEQDPTTREYRPVALSG
ncbi:MAG TPA: helix-turn-helix domain-containing protein [Solirubrobacteraceae bacterium]|nr:helix-turn-helix domain-containing protein [Solirubrobacteraceae bacterium]